MFRKRRRRTRRVEAVTIKYLAALLMVAMGSFSAMLSTAAIWLGGEGRWSGPACLLAALCCYRSVSMAVSLSQTMEVPILDVARRRVLSADRPTRMRFFVYVTVLFVFLIVSVFFGG